MGGRADKYLRCMGGGGVAEGQQQWAVAVVRAGMIGQWICWGALLLCDGRLGVAGGRWRAGGRLAGEAGWGDSGDARRCAGMMGQMRRVELAMMSCYGRVRARAGWA